MGTMVKYIEIGNGYCRPNEYNSDKNARVHGIFRDNITSNLCENHCSSNTKCIGYGYDYSNSIESRCWNYGEELTGIEVETSVITDTWGKYSGTITNDVGRISKYTLYNNIGLSSGVKENRVSVSNIKCYAKQNHIYQSRKGGKCRGTDYNVDLDSDKKDKMPGFKYLGKVNKHSSYYQICKNECNSDKDCSAFSYSNEKVHIKYFMKSTHGCWIYSTNVDRYKTNQNWILKQATNTNKETSWSCHQKADFEEIKQKSYQRKDTNEKMCEEHGISLYGDAELTARSESGCRKTCSNNPACTSYSWRKQMLFRDNVERIQCHIHVGDYPTRTNNLKHYNDGGKYQCFEKRLIDNKLVKSDDNTSSNENSTEYNSNSSFDDNNKIGSELGQYEYYQPENSTDESSLNKDSQDQPNNNEPATKDNFSTVLDEIMKSKIKENL